jgi:methyl coenzyme M reductase subunit C-like uncharacterized protein (methanogenesis marker protein 7)
MGGHIGKILQPPMIRKSLIKKEISHEISDIITQRVKAPMDLASQVASMEIQSHFK